VDSFDEDEEGADEDGEGADEHEEDVADLQLGGEQELQLPGGAGDHGSSAPAGAAAQGPPAAATRPRAAKELRAPRHLTLERAKHFRAAGVVLFTFHPVKKEVGGWLGLLLLLLLVPLVLVLVVPPMVPGITARQLAG
jgi:hypothetical protein